MKIEDDDSLEPRLIRLPSGLDDFNASSNAKTLYVSIWADKYDVMVDKIDVEELPTILVTQTELDKYKLRFSGKIPNLDAAIMEAIGNEMIRIVRD